MLNDIAIIIAVFDNVGIWYDEFRTQFIVVIERSMARKAKLLAREQYIILRLVCFMGVVVEFSNAFIYKR
jgi:hypothetical protein